MVRAILKETASVVLTDALEIPAYRLVLEDQQGSPRKKIARRYFGPKAQGRRQDRSQGTDEEKRRANKNWGACFQAEGLRAKAGRVAKRGLAFLGNCESTWGGWGRKTGRYSS